MKGRKGHGRMRVTLAWNIWVASWGGRKGATAVQSIQILSNDLPKERAPEGSQMVELDRLFSQTRFTLRLLQPLPPTISKRGSLSLVFKWFLSM